MFLAMLKVVYRLATAEIIISIEKYVIDIRYHFYELYYFIITALSHKKT